MSRSRGPIRSAGRPAHPTRCECHRTPASRHRENRPHRCRTDRVRCRPPVSAPTGCRSTARQESPARVRRVTPRSRRSLIAGAAGNPTSGRIRTRGESSSRPRSPFGRSRVVSSRQLRCRLRPIRSIRTPYSSYPARNRPDRSPVLQDAFEVIQDEETPLALQLIEKHG